jgi:hypothetical protein
MSQNITPHKSVRDRAHRFITHLTSKFELDYALGAELAETLEREIEQAVKDNAKNEVFSNGDFVRLKSSACEAAGQTGTIVASPEKTTAKTYAVYLDDDQYVLACKAADLEKVEGSEGSSGALSGVKYELTDETVTMPSGATLRRIRALKYIPTWKVKKGDLGGFIESEKNLSHDGEAWVGEDARVYENGLITEDAYVCGNAEVYGNSMVTHNAIIDGHARIYGHAEVFGQAQVFGRAEVRGDAQVGGKCSVYGHAKIGGCAVIVDPMCFGGDEVADKNPVKLVGLPYHVTITDKHITIGSLTHPIEVWEKLGDEEIARMNPKFGQFIGKCKNVALLTWKLREESDCDRSNPFS